MLRTKAALVALIVALPLALPGSLSAHEFTASTRLTRFKVPGGSPTAPGQPVIIHGRLRSVQEMCRFDRVVRLMRVRNKRPDRIIARTTTNREGQYMFLRRPNRSQRVYVEFRGLNETGSGHRHQCRPSKSRVIRILVG
jgi:hypothetical protein